jgi:hypothetical protein
MQTRQGANRKRNADASEQRITDAFTCLVDELGDWWASPLAWAAMNDKVVLFAQTLALKGGELDPDVRRRVLSRNSYANTAARQMCIVGKLQLMEYDVYLQFASFCDRA